MGFEDQAGLSILPSLARFEAAPGALRVRAPAKLNLDLLVGPRGADGYHPLDSLVARIAFYDEIELSARPDGGLALVCGGADCGPDEQNLALRAARALADARGPDASDGADIALTKRIPPGKGLAGGSSDAAAVLAGLDRLWGLHTGRAELGALALRLGSDVPLFLGPRAARMTGRGECLAPVKLHDFHALLCLPDFACPTAAVYAAFDERAGRTATRRRWARRRFPLKALAGPPSRWRHLLENHLAGAAETVRPELAEIRKGLASATGLPVCLTGSGSALFILCDGPDEARAALAAAPEGLRHRCLLVGRNAW